jgi:hypothetical protein
MMRLRLLALAVCLLGAVSVQAEDNFNWQKGTLTATERQKIKEGSTITHNTDASAKDSGNKSDYSSNTTTTKSDNYENYQVYTIESGNIVYVASEHLLFPWSKSADISIRCERGQDVYPRLQRQAAQSHVDQDISAEKHELMVRKWDVSHGEMPK